MLKIYKDIRLNECVPVFYLPTEYPQDRLGVRCYFFLFAPAVMIWGIVSKCLWFLWRDLMSLNTLLKLTKKGDN